LLDVVNSPADDSHVLEHVRSLVDRSPADGLGSKSGSLLVGNQLARDYGQHRQCFPAFATELRPL
jgi:hypothetical protein